MRTALAIPILFVCITTGDGLLNQKPHDYVAIAGKSAYFNCSTSEPTKPILWYHYATNEAHRENIYQYVNFTDYWYPCYRKGRYVVERNPETGAYNLVIPMVLLSDAGRYLCEVEGDEGVATLTVQVEYSPMFAASGMCKPYTKPYSVAIICIVLIILPIAIGATIFVMWYLLLYRPKKRKREANKEADANGKMANDEASSPEGTEHLLRRPSTDDLATKIQKLEADLEGECSEAKALENQLSGEIITLQEKNKASEIEIRHLEAKVTDIEQSLYPAETSNYADKRNSVSNIQLTGKNKGKSINGIAILSNELFVVTESSHVLEVYYSKTFKHKRDMKVSKMGYPLDIASSKDAKCLYIVGRFSEETESQVVRIDLGGRVLNQWSTGGERGRLSTYGSNVILCLSDKQLILEYLPDGTPVVTVSLSPAVKLNNPLHAIKVSSAHFVVTHGDFKDEKERGVELHRVCVIDLNGNIKQERRVEFPICLVEGKERSIIVANQHSNLILSLSSVLEYQEKLIGEEQLPQFEGSPVRLCFDDTQSTLFIAVNRWCCDEETWKDGHILFFTVEK